MSLVVQGMAYILPESERSQSTGSRPAATSAAFARLNGRLPKKPLWADSGDGCADSMTWWREVSIRSACVARRCPRG